MTSGALNRQRFICLWLSKSKQAWGQNFLEPVPFLVFNFKFISHSTPQILSWRRPLSYRNQHTDLLCKSIDWFLYDRDLRYERISCLHYHDKAFNWQNSFLLKSWFQVCFFYNFNYPGPWPVFSIGYCYY